MTTLQITIDDETKVALQQQSEQVGISVDDYVAQLLARVAASAGPTIDAVDDGRPSMLDFLNHTQPPGLYKTSVDVDNYLNDERNSWDS